MKTFKQRVSIYLSDVRILLNEMVVKSGLKVKLEKAAFFILPSTTQKIQKNTMTIVFKIYSL